MTESQKILENFSWEESAEFWRNASEKARSTLTANSGQLKVKARFTSYNGTPVRIFDDDGTLLIQLRSIAQAIGYSNFVAGTVLDNVLKNANPPIKIVKRKLSTSVPHFITLQDCFRLLESFLKANLSALQPIHRQEEYDFNAKKLLEQLKEAGFYPDATASVSVSEEGKTECKNMTEEITTLTEADIEDIGKRANLIKNVFDVPKSAALQATVKLKAEEIGRNLAPLIELLNKN